MLVLAYTKSSGLWEDAFDSVVSLRFMDGQWIPSTNDCYNPDSRFDNTDAQVGWRVM